MLTFVVPKPVRPIMAIMAASSSLLASMASPSSTSSVGTSESSRGRDADGSLSGVPVARQVERVGFTDGKESDGGKPVGVCC